MKKHLWAICYGLVLTAFTVYISLDTFVISTEYDTNGAQMNTSMFINVPQSSTSTESEDTPYSSGDSSSQTESDSAPDGSEASSDVQEPTSDTPDGSEENIIITMTEYVEKNTKTYVADVQLSSAQYLKTAFAKDTYGKNVTAKTSEIAAANEALLAVNGDFYGTQERGYVIRNGILYRDTASDNDVLCVYADGTLEVVKPREYSAQELLDRGVWQAFSFGPGLIEDGQITVGQGEDVKYAWASNPRTAIGVISPNHYLFVVSDGRTSESKGLSLYDLAQFMQSLGATTAYNLDGGGSSTMYFNGEVINKPTTTGKSFKEREVSDIVYIG